MLANTGSFNGMFSNISKSASSKKSGKVCLPRERAKWFFPSNLWECAPCQFKPLQSYERSEVTSLTLPVRSLWTPPGSIVSPGFVVGFSNPGWKKVTRPPTEDEARIPTIVANHHTDTTSIARSISWPCIMPWHKNYTNKKKTKLSYIPRASNMATMQSLHQVHVPQP